MPKQGFVVAIDGPAGTGKSSATRRLAQALGFVHIDTGALYRSIAFLLLEREVLDGQSGEGQGGERVLAEERAVELARSLHLEFKRLPRENPSNRIFADGRDITALIRSPEVSLMSSRISAIPGVRSALLGLQRRLGCAGNAILEGRDIGTVVFPDADAKFFLTASVDERAKRRLAEYEALGADSPSFEEVRTQIIERDRGDSTRAVAPLRRAEDAVEIDTSLLTLDDVVRAMENEIRQRQRSAPKSVPQGTGPRGPV